MIILNRKKRKTLVFTPKRNTIIIKQKPETKTLEKIKRKLDINKFRFYG